MIAAVHFLKIVFPLFSGQASGREPIMRFTYFYVNLRNFKPLAHVQFSGTAHVLINLASGLLAVRNGLDNHIGAPWTYIPAGEYAFLAGRGLETANGQLAVLFHFHIGGPIRLVVYVLVDGSDNAAALQEEI